MFLHGATWGGHPVSCAVALANLEVFETEDVLGNVQRNEGWFGEQLRGSRTAHEIVGDVRGTGLLLGARAGQGPRAQGPMFDDAESEDLLRGFLSAGCSSSG
jgi:adenosylmethionine-8-amino-7-oxononanoate aminotransferase